MNAGRDLYVAASSDGLFSGPATHHLVDDRIDHVGLAVALANDVATLADAATA